MLAAVLLGAVAAVGARADPPADTGSPMARTADPAATEDALASISNGPDPSSKPVDAFIERLREFQSFQSDDGQISFNVDLWLTLDYFVMSQPPPGFIQTSSGQLFAPSLSGLFTMNVSQHIGLVFLGLVNRGFDPADTSVQAMPAEYYVQIMPFDSPVLNFKGGKFETAFGQWVNRHFSTQNSLINAPLMYGWETTITDGAGPSTAGVPPNIAPAMTGFLARKNIPDTVSRWIPMVWGPSYASGFQLNGTVETFDWAVEMKNAPLASRPEQWDLWNRGFNYPTMTGRIGLRPDAAWNLGVSASSGSYVDTSAYKRFSATTAPGATIGQARQTMVGCDISYAHGPIELWAEFAQSRYDVPDAPAGKPVGAIDAYSYFVEGKWKFMPQFWLSGRWNQQIYSKVTPVVGAATPWDNNLWRIDACLGVKLDRFVQLKTQYSYTEESGSVHQGQNLFAVELVIQF